MLRELVWGGTRRSSKEVIVGDYETVVLLLEEFFKRTDNLAGFRWALGEITFRHLKAINREIVDEILEKYSS